MNIEPIIRAMNLSKSGGKEWRTYSNPVLVVGDDLFPLFNKECYALWRDETTNIKYEKHDQIYITDWAFSDFTTPLNKRDYVLPFLDWLINFSPWRDVFPIKNALIAQNKGIVVEVTKKYTISFVIQALWVNRVLGFYHSIMDIWYCLYKKGYCPIRSLLFLYQFIQYTPSPYVLRVHPYFDNCWGCPKNFSIEGLNNLFRGDSSYFLHHRWRGFNFHTNINKLWGEGENMKWHEITPKYTGVEVLGGGRFPEYIMEYENIEIVYLQWVAKLSSFGVT